MSSHRNSFFTKFAKHAAHLLGSPITFGVAIAIVAGWLACGPIFGFNDTWQLAINTTTTIITFLMVFLLQNTQNRDTAAVQVKLDELIRVTENAKNALLDLEELDERELEALRSKYEDLAARAGGSNGLTELRAEDNGTQPL